MTKKIIRQVGLPVETEFIDGWGKSRIGRHFGIVYTQYDDGTITRYTIDRKNTYQDDETEIGHLPVYKVDKNAYLQHIAFKRFIAQHAYNMTYEQAMARGLLANRPETIDELRARREYWWEQKQKSWNKRKQVESE